uniref:Uncharacterized protein n=1 Tax=Mycena chlorophos TaxID=658473 RepID=A0ABQ0L283_MYCCL|nr:predicted protein [Mycena chlorophos]
MPTSSSSFTAVILGMQATPPSPRRTALPALSHLQNKDELDNNPAEEENFRAIETRPARFKLTAYLPPQTLQAGASMLTRRASVFGPGRHGIQSRPAGFSD